MSRRPKIKTIGMIGRWQPVHLGHEAALRALCDQFEKVSIGIGSSNIEDYRCPFTQHEVIEMLEIVLPGYSNFTLIPVADMPDDEDWTQSLLSRFEGVEHFVTANPYVSHLLRGHFSLSHPASFIPAESKVAVSGTMVRREMACGDRWKAFVPRGIADYILDHGLDKRFRQAYGLHTLAMETIIV